MKLSDVDAIFVVPAKTREQGAELAGSWFYAGGVQIFQIFEHFVETGCVTTLSMWSTIIIIKN